MKTTKILLVMGMLMGSVFAHAEVTCSARAGAPITQNDANSKRIAQSVLSQTSGDDGAAAADGQRD